MSIATLRERFATWALRARAPEPSPIVLTQRRVYVLPTRAGLAYAASLLIMLLASINYNLSLGHALVFLLAGLGVVAIFHTFRNLAGLSISAGRTGPVFAGETAHFALLLQADGERRRLRIHVPGSATEVDVTAGAPTEARLGLPAERRGWLALPRVTLETSYPLGLVRGWSYAAPGMRCLVYPRPARAAPEMPPGGGDRGERPQHDRRGNEDFAGLRNRQPADSLRHVAWKAAARMDGASPLLTKQFAGAGTEVFWIDWDALPPQLDVETRLSILTRWVLDAADAGVAWGLRLPGTVLAPASGDAHRHACLKALALHEAR